MSGWFWASVFAALVIVIMVLAGWLTAIERDDVWVCRQSFEQSQGAPAGFGTHTTACGWEDR